MSRPVAFSAGTLSPARFSRRGPHTDSIAAGAERAVAAGTGGHRVSLAGTAVDDWRVQVTTGRRRAGPSADQAGTISAEAGRRAGHGVHA